MKGIAKEPKRRGRSEAAEPEPLVEWASVDRLIPMREVIQITSWSRTSIYRLIARDEFPVPRKCGRSKVGFLMSEIQDYVASRRPCPGTPAAQQEARIP